MKSNECRRGNERGQHQNGHCCLSASASNQPITTHRLIPRTDKRRGGATRAVPPAAPTVHPMSRTIWLMLILVGLGLSQQQANAYKSTISSKGSGPDRMVRLCIASVDPIKLTSQCVMCNRREFPLTVIDCTGITKVNDLIASPLSVQEATCLIYNCRRQVPNVKPEPYHGSLSHAVNYRGSASSYHQTGMATAGPVSGSSIYEMITPSGVFESGYPVLAANGLQSPIPTSSTYTTRFGSGFSSSTSGSPYDAYSSSVPRGMIGGPNLSLNGHQALPYALVPAPRTFPFGSRKYNAALVPLYRRRGFNQ